MSVAKELQVLISGQDNATGTLKGVHGQLQQMQADLNGVGGHAQKASQEAANAGSSFSSMAGSLAKVGLATAGVGLGVGALAAGFKSSIDAASNLNETMSKSSVVFGESSRQVAAFGDSAAKSIGQSKQQAVEAAASFGNLFIGMGTSKDAAAGMSIQMVKLASDLASFNNIPVDMALEKIRAGLVGEAEPLRAVGVLLSEEAVKLEAVRMGLVKQGQDLTETQKVQARYNLILSQTTTAQGDFARTSDGLANSTRILEAKFADFQARLGAGFLPIAAKAVTVAGDLLGVMGDLAGTMAAVVTTGRLIGPSLSSAATGMNTLAAQSDTATRQVRAFNAAWREFGQMGMRDQPGGGPGATSGLLTNAEQAMLAAIKLADAQETANKAMRDGNAELIRQTAAAIDSYDAKNDRLAREADALAKLDPLTARLNKLIAEGNWEAIRAEAAATDSWEVKVDRLAREEEARKEAEADARKGASEAESAAKRLATALENADEKAINLAEDIRAEVGDALYRIAEIGEESGQRWIEKWFDVNAAIKDTERAMRDAVSALDEQEFLNSTIAARRRALDDRLSGEEKIFRATMDDEEYHWREARELTKLSEREKIDLSHARDEEERKQVRSRYAQERNEINTRHVEYDEEVAHRRDVEQKESWWRQEVATQQSQLEKELHDEEIGRRRAAIEAEAKLKIEKANADWLKWQADEAVKTGRLKAEEEQRAKDKLAAWEKSFYRGLPDAAGEAIDAIKAKIGAAFAEAVATLPSGEGSGGGGGGEGGGGGADYIDPRHYPGGDVFDDWWSRLDTDTKTEFQGEHPDWPLSMDAGGTVPGPLGARRLVVARGGEEFGGYPPRGGRSLTINVTGNTMLADESRVARELARILKPELDRIVGGTW